MSRVRGSISFSSNYEASISKPMDARMLVPSYEDLLDNNNWITSKETPCCFNGMLVAVANTKDTSKNGLYMLFDGTNARKPDVTVETNWIKIGETSDISDFVSRIQTIESSIAEITSDITALDARVSELERLHNEDNVERFGYRNMFPAVGVLNRIYIANDEKRTYIYTTEGYIHIADQFDTIDHDEDENTPEVRIIFGGTAE